MSDSRDTGDLPPDLPPEYAEAYRRGYERAMRAFPEEPDEDAEAEEQWHEGLFVGTDANGRRERRLMVPALLALMAVLLLVSIYGLGRVFTGSDPVQVADPAPNGEAPAAGQGTPSVAGTEDATDGTDGTDGTTGPDEGATDGAADGATDGATDGAAGGATDDPAGPEGATPSPDAVPEGTLFRGPVEEVMVTAAQGSCGGRTAGQAHDGDVGTAWTCRGDGRGRSLTLQLSQETLVGEIGLLPGRAAADEADALDAFARHNRITTVRWDFSDGTSHLMAFSGDEADADLHKIRIPATAADSVTIEILATVAGATDVTAISEVWLAVPTP